jgi:hypothetical protein
LSLIFSSTKRVPYGNLCALTECYTVCAQADSFSKFGFSQLALVERPAPEAAVSCVTLHMPDGTFSQIEIQRRQGTQQTEKAAKIVLSLSVFVRKKQQFFLELSFCIRKVSQLLGSVLRMDSIH